MITNSISSRHDGKFNSYQSDGSSDSLLHDFYTTDVALNPVTISSEDTIAIIKAPLVNTLIFEEALAEVEECVDRVDSSP